ncbi:MAG: transporter substrate-binding protein [Haloplasmataceae bacterium]|jgi:putative ABC transport system substrate-binding protein|nr:transporter substrate-binding protein [Haloplasmataceae bacterium]
MVGKKLKSLSFIMIMVFVLVGCTKEDDGKFTIGITQIVEHDALDRTREGFIAGLATRGYVENENVEFIFQNAQDSIETADLIAKNFVSKKVDLIMAIATPSAQAVKNATNKKPILPFLKTGAKIPVVFSAVTDPVTAGLVDSNEAPGGNVTGTSDMTPMEKQFELIQIAFPGKTRIGIVYNTGEVNSQVQVDLAKSLKDQFGFTIIEKGITATSEIALAVDSIVDEIDILYIPTDNKVASSIPVIMDRTLDKGIPVIASEAGMVEAGALLTEGLDYYNLGFQTGLMAADILDGKKPSEIPVETLKETQLIINELTLETLGITLPETVLERAQMVSGE